MESVTPFARASCLNCAEGLRPERPARRLKGGGLTREILPALDYSNIHILWRKFHHAANIARVIIVDKVERVGRCYPAAVQAGRLPSLASHA